MIVDPGLRAQLLRGERAVERHGVEREAVGGVGQDGVDVGRGEGPVEAVHGRSVCASRARVRRSTARQAAEGTAWVSATSASSLTTDPS